MPRKPSSDVCAASTQSMYPTVAYSGNAMNCLNVSIHAPGRGRIFTACGKMDRSRYGADNPTAIAVKMANDSMGETASAAPSAGARKGALHGVATAVASTPVRNDSVYCDFCFCIHGAFETAAGALRPNSK